jgi:DNA invertase Pin-like site-specific DNA recombinase
MKKAVTYCRVSTKKQGVSGLGLEAQQEQIATFLKGGDWEVISAYEEIESGSVNNRVELDKAVKEVVANDATLIFAKLDRFSRDVELTAKMLKSGVKFKICEMPSATEFTIHIYAAVAMEERRMAIARTIAGLKAAKARGVKLGNPNIKLIQNDGAKGMSKNSTDFARSVYPIIQQIQKAGIVSARGIAVALNSRGVDTYQSKRIPTPRWQAQQVTRILSKVA